MNQQRQQTRPASQADAELQEGFEATDAPLKDVQDKLASLRAEQKLRQERLANFTLSPEDLAAMKKSAGISASAKEAADELERTRQVGGQ